MYTDYFGLKESPFSITPDPAYFYISEKHREALAHLMYAFDSDGGFVLLTGEVGTGKTTVCRRLLKRVPENCDIAFILYPKLTGKELLAALCDELRIDHVSADASSRVLVARIYDHLVKAHERGRRTILIVEEAQNLSDDVLEQIRLLTNLETNKQKLLQVVMIGQPELRERLGRPELAQLNQRITARYHLTPLSYEEVEGYVEHRLTVAGLSKNRLFPPGVLKELFRLTRGVPRLINVICDRALTGVYVQGKDRVDRKTLLAAVREVSGREGLRPSLGKRLVIPVLSVALLGACLAAIYYGRSIHQSTQATGWWQTWTESASTPSTVTTGEAILREAVAPAEPHLDVLDSPPVRTELLTKERALQTLLGKWQVALKVKGVPQTCARLGAYRLSCLEGTESLDAIRTMNRPAVLRLSDAGDRDSYVVLSSLSTQTAEVVIGGETKVIDIRELGRRWSGDYLLLWRLPPGYREEIRLGDRGSFVSWLAKQLSISEGRAVEPGPTETYGDDMVRRVKQFQIGAGLVPDGVVGPKTLIRLRGVAGDDEPRLGAARGGH